MEQVDLRRGAQGTGEIAAENVEFAQFSLKVFDSIVLADQVYADLIHCDVYKHKTYYMGTVDDNNQANFYDGKIRVVDPEGREFSKFAAADYSRAHRGARRAVDVPEVPLS